MDILAQSGSFLRVPPLNDSNMSEQPPQPKLSDLDKVHLGMEAAETESRPIDDATARRIAMLYHRGQGSELYSFGSSGKIDRLRLTPEMLITFTEYEDADSRLMMNALGRYVAEHGNRPRQKGWYRITHDLAPPINWLRGGDAS